MKVCFPQEVKIDADETLDSYTGEGFISNSILQTQVIKSPFVYGASLSSCGSNFVLVPGCTDPTFLGASGQGIIHLEKVVSPAQLKDTDSFLIEFYKDQGMNSLIATTATSTGLNLYFS